MNLETQIKPELWEAIATSYQARNYTHAIKDAMSVITDTLRDKSGLDGDGDPLVGKALGFSDGKPPTSKNQLFPNPDRTRDAERSNVRFERDVCLSSQSKES
jgi:hypothetical protein